MKPDKRATTENNARHAPHASARYMPPHILVPLIERNRLLDLMEKARSQKLTLLRAPGGYGKTSLLVQWWNRLEQDDAVRIWLGLSAQHSEPDTFITGLAEAAGRAGLNVTPPDTQGPLSGNISKLSQSFADMLASHEGDIIVFLDDYHLIRSDRVDTPLDELLRNTGPNVHFVIASRSTPAIAVQTLRIEGQLTEIDILDLSFTDEETLRFFEDALDEDTLTMLAHKTEGWPAALQMINLNLAQGQDIDILLNEFSGQNNEVADYLAEKVLKRLPKEKVDFLLRTSILRLINGDIADFVCERTDGWSILDSLDELGAFLVPTSAERTWYRYHDLFAEFLQGQLRHIGRSAVERLHERASIWYESHGQTIDALQHALAVNDLERVVALIQSADSGSFWLIDNFSAHTGLFKRLPGTFIEDYPRLRALKAIELIKSGEMEKGSAMLDALDEEIGDDDTELTRLARDMKLSNAVRKVYLDGPVDLTLVADLEQFIRKNPNETLMLGALHNALTLFYHRLGETKKAEDSAQVALELYLESGSRYGAVFMHLHRGMFALVAGHLEKAFSCYKRGEDLFHRYLGDAELATLITLFKSEAHYERGELDAAQSGLAESVEQASLGDSWLEVLVGGYRSASALAFATEGYAAAMAVLDRAETTAEDRGYARLEHWARMRRIYLASVAGKIDEAQHLCAEYGIGLKDKKAAGELSWRETHKHRLALARLALAEEHYEGVIPDLEALGSDAQAQGHGWLELKVMLLKAAALMELGRMDDAAPLVRRLLEWTRKETMPSIILEEGGLALDLIESFVRQTGIGELAAGQLDWIAELMARASDYRYGPALDPDPFSVRELDVIDGLRDDLPTKRIADRLEISDSAVAFHLKNIFKKAGVRNRHLVIPVIEKRQALARAAAEQDG
ncbi:hypothetical protein HFP57_07500 [Parasphingopyxis algicola]|uniref:LuxR C-terminal-related transcriptional regulator n=1 Tax=Parasphingopyxis algicola TaxID=2026624 RepID=UPI00159FD4FC|nr:LuxR C-terminal-related transcriptional regulator [Parasphingopyxis algicola]QLC24887.1 hypothetical protein HFP57_07500 [Parasphingopyxis algicola]